MEMKNEIGFLGMQYFAEKNQSTHRNQNAWFPYFLIFCLSCHEFCIVSSSKKHFIESKYLNELKCLIL